MICYAVVMGFCLSMPGRAVDYYVATNGSDSARGTSADPFRTIQRAAEMAFAGDTITVRGGTYRERVNPPRGGLSDEQRIVYQAEPGAIVEIKGSEVVKGWTRVRGNVWSVTLPDSFFGGFHPFRLLLHGDWFRDKGRAHHRGSVYVNGDWLAEAATKDQVFAGPGRIPLWYVEPGDDHIILYAQFPGKDPDENLVEVSVRESVFYPDQPGRHYITVRGFVMRQAATPWAPPTAEQIGLIGTHWSRGWIIESNTISHSMCAGISLGKYGDEFDNMNESADGFIRTIARASSNGWSRGAIGHHTVRGNRISHCEQAGIVGSLGCSFSTVVGNVIHDIHVRAAFGGFEQAGIKLHGAVDTLIGGNHVYRCSRGLWLDWMAQGARVSGNLFHDNRQEDVLLEMNHGPHLLDHNVMLSKTALNDWSEEGAFVHNWFGGVVKATVDQGRKRRVPYLEPHATVVTGVEVISGGGNRFFNNVFIVNGLSAYDRSEIPIVTGGNVYRRGAVPFTNEVCATFVDAESLRLELAGSELRLVLGEALMRGGMAVPGEVLTNRTRLSGMAFADPVGAPFAMDHDFFGNPRNPTNPTPGPFEIAEPGTVLRELTWPK